MSEEMNPTPLLEKTLDTAEQPKEERRRGASACDHENGMLINNCMATYTIDGIYKTTQAIT